MSDERIAPSFWLSEFLHSDAAVRKGIDNTPAAMHLANIRNVLAPGMQRVRECLGAPVLISSGYRSPMLNRAIGGSATSQHCEGLAADFRAPAFGSPREVAQRLVAHAAALRFDQLIHEGAWVHISFAPQPRGQVLTAHFFPNRVTYTEGLS